MSQQTLIQLPGNELVSFLGKATSAFTFDDIMRVIVEKKITQVHFRYVAADGRLKLLRIPVNNRNYIEQVLTMGERIDGSSVFPKVVDPACSDMYIVPMYRSAFLDPFEANTLTMICRFVDPLGQPHPDTADTCLANAHARVKKELGYELWCLTELEFYLIMDAGKGFPGAIFPFTSQRGYHEGAPFIRGEHVVTEMLNKIQNCMDSVKYVHTEVGCIENIESDSEELKNKRLEQHEVEFRPTPVEDLAWHSAVAKWIMRTVAYNHGMSVTFAPKLTEHDAGSGLHVQWLAYRNGKSIMLRDCEIDGRQSETLSDDGLKIVAGLLHCARSICAFGNTIPSAFLRLVPGHEAPTKICWSESNRSALVRIPLGWRGVQHLSKAVNPGDIHYFVHASHDTQTAEYRAADGSANVYLLLAAMCVSICEGAAMSHWKEFTDKMHVVGNIHKKAELAKLYNNLPASCFECAAALKQDREMYERAGVFTKRTIDHVINQLEAWNDEKMNERLSAMTDEQRLQEGRKIMHSPVFLHTQ